MLNPLSLEAFAEWLEKRPAEGKYNPASSDRCAAAKLGDDSFNLAQFIVKPLFAHD